MWLNNAGQKSNHITHGLIMGKKATFWRLLIGAFVLLIAIYASTSTYIWARQAHFIFRPERIVSNTPAEYQLPFEDVYVNAQGNIRVAS